MTTGAVDLRGAVLQRGEGELPGDHYLAARPEQLLWGRLPCASDAPVLSVAPGETVTVDTLSTRGCWRTRGATRSPSSDATASGPIRCSPRPST